MTLAMSELKPCKCRCGAEPLLKSETKLVWRHPPGYCFAADLHIYPRDVLAWNALMSDTPALLRGARIGLGMAAGEVDDLSIVWRKAEDKSFGGESQRAADRALHYENLAAEIRAITDADIMKEISRE